MTHISTTELKQFIAGKLAAQRLLEVDEHISGCAQCREALDALPANRRAGLDLGAMLLGAKDCPEYEQLSAYVDDELDTDETATVEAHVNLCDLCTRDVSRMAEMRSHAALRAPITVGPGMIKQAPRVTTPIWKRLFAGACAAATVVVAVFMFSTVMQAPATRGNGNMAKGSHVVPGNPPEAIKPDTGANGPGTDLAQNNVPTTNIVVDRPVPNAPERPAPKSLLRDGSYGVYEQNGTLVLTKAGAPQTHLEARIAASVNEKLRTGQIKVDRPVRLAMASIAMRGPSNLQPSDVAPNPIGPSEKILLTNRPTLSWSKVDLAESYRVVVKGQSGEIVADQVTDQTALTLPEPLHRGEVYTWQVGVRFSKGDKWEESKLVSFGVLSYKDYASIRRLQREMPDSHLALGVAYESFGLTAEAHREYAAVRAANRGSALARKLR